MRILITGCAGFIGSHLAEKLIKEGNTVIGIDNFDPFYDKKIKENNLSWLREQNQFYFHQVDIRERNFYLDIEDNIDLIVHLAAKAGVQPSLAEPEEYFKTNILGTQHILDWMVKAKIKKLIFASSSSVYGNNKKVPFNENDPVDHPISPYAFTKKACELLNHTYHKLYDIDIINLRFFTVYGPRQRPDLAIHKFTKMIKADIPLTMYGDGSSGRDYTYIDDTINGIKSAIDYVVQNTDIYEIVNLGNHEPVKLLYLIDRLYQLQNKKPQIKQLPMQPGDVDITFADISKANVLFNYFPSTSIDEGLKKFNNWYDRSEISA